MSSRSLVDRVRNLVKQPAFLIVRDVLGKVPGRPIQVARFFLLSLASPAVSAVRGFGTVREGTVADVGGMCLLEDKRDVFLKRLAAGESCMVAVHDDQIVGYEWFSDKPYHLEERFEYRIKIPNDSIYAYDGFIKHEYRLRGIWVLFQKYMLDQLNTLQRDKIITMVDYGNNASLKAHLRFGYTITTDVVYCRLLGTGSCREKQYVPGEFDPRRVMTP